MNKYIIKFKNFIRITKMVKNIIIYFEKEFNISECYIILDWYDDKITFEDIDEIISKEKYFNLMNNEEKELVEKMKIYKKILNKWEIFSYST